MLRATAQLATGQETQIITSTVYMDPYLCAFRPITARDSSTRCSVWCLALLQGRQRLVEQRSRLEFFDTLLGATKGQHYLLAPTASCSSAVLRVRLQMGRDS